MWLVLLAVALLVPQMAQAVGLFPLPVRVTGASLSAASGFPSYSPIGTASGTGTLEIEGQIGAGGPGVRVTFDPAPLPELIIGYGGHPGANFSIDVDLVLQLEFDVPDLDGAVPVVPVIDADTGAAPYQDFSTFANVLEIWTSELLRGEFAVFFYGALEHSPPEQPRRETTMGVFLPGDRVGGELDISAQISGIQSESPFDVSARYSLQSIPEPSACAMLAAAVFGLAAMRRSRI